MMLNGRYKLLRKLESGGFGSVHLTLEIRQVLLLENLIPALHLPRLAPSRCI